jgi:hypothetical protein
MPALPYAHPRTDVLGLTVGGLVTSLRTSHPLCTKYLEGRTYSQSEVSSQKPLTQGK